MMNVFRASLVLLAAAMLAACDNSPKPPAPAPAEPAAEVRTAPAAPVPGTSAPAPAPEVAVVAPVPAPSTQRPLSRAQQAALDPLFGTWATDLNNCERGAITISMSRFEGAESGCDIVSLADTGGWNFVATLSCTNGGQTARERVGMVPLYAPSGEAVGLTYLDRENQAVTVYRCD